MKTKVEKQNTNRKDFWAGRSCYASNTSLSLQKETVIAYLSMRSFSTYVGNILFDYSAKAIWSTESIATLLSKLWKTQQTF